MITFEELIGSEYVSCLQLQNIHNPTEIQEKAIPAILSGQDLIAASQTGSGKTLAYLLPIFKKIDMQIKTPQAVILAPTHELAVQIHKQAEYITKALNNGVTAALIIGGANKTRQLEHLKEKPRIIIGSTGRIFELNQMKKLSMHNVKTIVLDEGDRLLDDKNFENVNKLIKTTLRDRQLVLFSATVSSKAYATAVQIMKEPVYINVKKEGIVPENIEHMYFVCDERKKIEVLRKIVHGEKITKAIVFINNSESLEAYVKRLNFHGIMADGLYGEADKERRKKALDAFRAGRITLLVASDLAARGLDIKDISHVINIDVTEETEFYLHRVGRCGRAGNKGFAITIAAPKEIKCIKKYEKALNIKITQKEMSFGSISEPKL